MDDRKAILGYKSSYFCHDLDRDMDANTVCCEIKCRFASICTILEATMRLSHHAKRLIHA
jgi:hypothetical protein